MPNNDFYKSNSNKEEGLQGGGKQQKRNFDGLNTDKIKNRKTPYLTTNVANWKKQLLKSIQSNNSTGSKILIEGGEGTVKAATAEMIAGELNKELYKVDVSKGPPYIGETEKDIDKLFYTVEKEDQILFLDEADGLFGKRTGVKDSHDKYAKQEVSYLLKRVEDFRGIVIIATSKPIELADYSETGINLSLVLIGGGNKEK